MLKVYIGENSKSLGSPSKFFEYGFNKDYLEDDYAKYLIKSIDNNEVVSKYNIVSPILGSIPPSRMSSGVKNLLIAKYCKGVMINFANMGRNCMPYLCEIAMLEDVEVCMDCFYIPYNYGYKGEILILNDNSIVTNDTEFLDKWEIFDEEDILDEG